MYQRDILKDLTDKKILSVFSGNDRLIYKKQNFVKIMDI